VTIAAYVLYLDQGTLDALQWGIVIARVLVPLGFLIALLQADRFAGMALRTMLEESYDCVVEKLTRRERPAGWLPPGERGS